MWPENYSHNFSGSLVRFIFVIRLRWDMILEQDKIFFADSLASDASATHVIDLAKMASSLNRKHVPSVDRNGNAQLFVVKVSSNGSDTLTAIQTAPNLYTTKAAVKAWHDARVKMITRGGMKMSDLGPYARHLRPFLDVNHENGSTTEIDDESSGTGGLTLNTHFQGDEYTRSRLAVTVPQKDDLTGGVASYDLVDSYSLTLCDASVLESTTADSPDGSGSVSDQDSFVSVGMIDSWLSSISKAPLATADSLRIQADNPLIQLRIDSPSSEEVLEIVEDSAAEGRPWDLDGSQYTSLTGQAYYRSSANQSKEQIIYVPCGLLQLDQVNGHSATETITTEFQILDIYDT